MTSSIGRAGPQQVSPEDSALIYLERQAIESTSTVVDTGSPDEFLDFLQKGGKPSTFIWCDKLGNQVGYLALVDLEDSDDVEVRSIAVNPDQRGTGFGKAMMNYAENIAAQSNKNKLILVVNPDNDFALKFYQYLGYVIAKRVKNYYGDGTPRYVLEKNVEHSSK